MWTPCPSDDRPRDIYPRSWLQIVLDWKNHWCTFKRSLGIYLFYRLTKFLASGHGRSLRNLSTIVLELQELVMWGQIRTELGVNINDVKYKKKKTIEQILKVQSTGIQELLGFCHQLCSSKVFCFPQQSCFYLNTLYQDMFGSRMKAVCDSPGSWLYVACLHLYLTSHFSSN